MSAFARAATVPFTEDFSATVSNWADNSAMNLLNHVPTGGPDGGAYASTSKSLMNLADQSVVLFRAQDEFNSSGHAFEGNWIADGVGTFSAYVRHNAPLPLTYFTRFSGPGNFPGGVAVKFAPVLPNTWTELKFDITPSNPEFVSFEGTSFSSVFSNVGHIQRGAGSGASAVHSLLGGSNLANSSVECKSSSSSVKYLASLSHGSFTSLSRRMAACSPWVVLHAPDILPTSNGSTSTIKLLALRLVHALSRRAVQPADDVAPGDRQQ